MKALTDPMIQSVSEEKKQIPNDQQINVRVKNLNKVPVTQEGAEEIRDNVKTSVYHGDDGGVIIRTTIKHDQ